MRLQFYYDKQRSDMGEVSRLIERLKDLKSKSLQIRILDIGNMPKDEVFKIYANAWRPSVHKKYKIRRVFGTHRQPGILFGRKPALLVYEADSEYPTDIYPHDAHGRIVTIEEFIDNLRTPRH